MDQVLLDSRVACLSQYPSDAQRDTGLCRGQEGIYMLGRHLQMAPQSPPSGKFPVTETPLPEDPPHGWLALIGTGLGTGFPVPHLAVHDAGYLSPCSGLSCTLRKIGRVTACTHSIAVR